MEPAVLVDNLSVRYRQPWARPVHALRGVDLTAAPGEVVGILGANGSGKTTLLEVLAGVRGPTSGQVRLLGTHPTDRALVARVGLQTVGPPPFPGLGARRLLRLQADLMGMPRARAIERVTHWLRALGLEAAADRPTASYSTGMQRRVALAGALLGDPEVLLLDEPTSGLDPTGSLLVREILATAAAAGTTVVMASHDLQEVEQLCRRVYVLSQGSCCAAGTLDDLLDTGSHELVVRGLDDQSLQRVSDAIRDCGGELVRVGREREHLFALYRRLTTRSS